GEAASHLEHGKSVGDLRPGTAELVRYPREWETGFLERVPEDGGPLALFGIVDDARRAQVLQKPRRRVDDDVVVVAHLNPSSRATMPFNTSFVPPRIVAEGTYRIPSRRTDP